MSKILIITDAYENSHGHAPRGRGGWLFTIGELNHARYLRGDYSAATHFHGTYTIARRQAIGAAKHAGVDTIHVLP